MLTSAAAENPSEYLPLLELVATETAREEFAAPAGDALADGEQHVQVVLRSSGNSIPIRQLSSVHVSRLVMVPGIVISASRVQAKATHLFLRCKNRECNDEMEVKVSRTGVFSGRLCWLTPFAVAVQRRLRGGRHAVCVPQGGVVAQHTQQSEMRPEAVQHR